MNRDITKWSDEDKKLLDLVREIHTGDKVMYRHDYSAKNELLTITKLPHFMEMLDPSCPFKTWCFIGEDVSGIEFRVGIWRFGKKLCEVVSNG